MQESVISIDSATTKASEPFKKAAKKH
jgi:hypothetical protein